MIREYFAVQLREREPEAFRAAHSRLFDHLCETTKLHQPDTLDGLQPLYQAVVHGCLAQRQQEACDEVYFDRILRGTGPFGNYSSFQLGAISADLAAVAAFFDMPWTRLSPNLSEADQGWLLNEAAFNLRALGRLTEAVEPMRTATETANAAENWESAAARFSNLSELEVTLGRLEEAVADARRAIDLADRSGDGFLRMGIRTTAADALHQRGQAAERREPSGPASPLPSKPDGLRRSATTSYVSDLAEARALFEEAEAIQCERQPEFNLLYSLGGFRYSDLLLAPAERAAWRVLDSRGSLHEPTLDRGAIHDYLAPLAEVERRAKEAQRAWREIFTNAALLDIALDHLTLARVTLYRAILEQTNSQSEIRIPQCENPHLAPALNSVRQSGRLDILPLALLTSALHHHVTGDAEAARRDLDEAQQIAERGPMPLYLADVHLHRARLFRDKSELASARKMIEAHSYGRRYEELAAAEAAAQDW